MSYTENARILKERIDSDKQVVDVVEKIGGIDETPLEQSDKIGFDWRTYSVNGIEVYKEYVKQDIQMGTQDNPIVWKETMQLIQNAYYIYDDVRKVWMGESGAVAEWTDSNFVEF